MTTLDEAVESLALLLSVVRSPLGEQAPTEEAGDVGAYWDKQAAAVKSVNYQTMKLLVMLSEPPFNKQNIETLTKEIILAVFAFNTGLRNFDQRHGMALFTAMQQHAVVVVRALQDLMGAIKEHIQNPSGKYLPFAGRIMESTEAFQLVPKTNGQAVSMRLRAVAGLLQDALQELTDSRNEQDEEEEEEDSEDEGDRRGPKAKVAPGVYDAASALITASGKLVVKTASLVEEGALQNNVVAYGVFDEISEVIKPLSEHCDDIIMALYEADLPKVRSDVDSFVAQNRSLVGAIRRLLPLSGLQDESGDRKWVKFLESVFDHNMTKLVPLLK